MHINRWLRPDHTKRTNVGARACLRLGMGPIRVSPSVFDVLASELDC